MRHLFAALMLIASASLSSQDDCDLFNIQELVEEYGAVVEENQQLHDSISDYIELCPCCTTDENCSLNLGNSGSVLIFSTTGGGTSLEDAANNLGVSYTYTASETDLLSAFNQGGYELLVIDHGVGSLSQDVIERIIGWVNRGSKLILSYGELYNHSDLLAAVGVEVASTTSVARNVYRPAALPVNLFGLPIVPGGHNAWNEFLFLEASASSFGLAVSGAELDFGTKPSGQSELGLILGRYDSGQTGAPAIMMTKHGRVIVHGFSTRPYAGRDIDGDANNDLRELFENEMLYFLTRSELGTREDMVRISAGTFTMGASILDPYQDADEYDRDVTISRDFQLGRTEVTNRLYGSVIGSIPSLDFNSCGYGCPLTAVNWEEAVLFANEMSLREGRDQCYQQTNPTLVDVDLDCNGYRLPTEAEWEYSAKAGTNSMLSSGNFTFNSCGTTETNVTSVAWFCGNSEDRTHPVAQLEPNANGLYDMHGNVWEWVTDVYGFYSFTSETDPIGVTSNPTGNRVIRGGAYNSSPASLRSSDRNTVPPSSGYVQVGFRLARTDVAEDWFQVDVLSNAQPVPSTGSVVTFSGLDDAISSLTIPFTFNFMGSDETQIYVSTNGVIGFDSSNLSTPTNRPIPLNGPPSAFFAGWWDDLDLSTSGAIRQETTGAAPNRVFAIHFDDVPRQSGSGSNSVSMSFYLFETSNIVEVHYGSISGSGWSASAGWKGSSSQLSGADVLGSSATSDESDFPAGQIFRYSPIRVR